MFFSDGQEIAIRLNKQMKEASKRLDKFIIQYNEVPSLGMNASQKIDRQQASNLESNLYSGMVNTHAQDIPIHVRKQMVELSHRLDRCVEELEYIKGDKANVLNTFRSELQILHTELFRINSCIEGGTCHPGRCQDESCIKNGLCQNQQLLQGKAVLLQNEINFVEKRLNDLDDLWLSKNVDQKVPNKDVDSIPDKIQMDREEREEVLSVLSTYDQPVQNDYLTAEDIVNPLEQ